VWMSLNNASSQSDGFDLYGVFLGPTGLRLSSPFRISDDNNVARSSRPTVVAGNGEFVAMWTTRTSSCRLYMQRVTDVHARPDQQVPLSSSTHLHSPQLTYDSKRQQYVAIFVEGDDYLPPKLFGADVNDCGNNIASSSQTK